MRIRSHGLDTGFRRSHPDPPAAGYGIVGLRRVRHSIDAALLGFHLLYGEKRLSGNLRAAQGAMTDEHVEATILIPGRVMRRLFAICLG